MQRDFERDDRRRRYRSDDDPRDDPRERFGNEEDPYSRDYRRAYADQDLPRRMQDDRPYNQPGYEPEGGRPGGRENRDLDRCDPYREARERYARDHADSRSDPRFGRPGQERGGYGRGGESWQGGFYGQGQRWGGERFQPEGRDERDPGTNRSSNSWRGNRAEPYRQPDYGFSSSPYDSGDVGAWYGGDTGMGDSGASQYGTPPGGGWQSSSRRWQGGSGQSQRFGQGGSAGSGRFSGRGPRGYQRSDDRIREDVCELLTRHGEIDASEMDVEVRGATVLLRGTADSGRTRRLAEELVEEIPGVQDVQNELRVSRTSRSSDAMTDSGTFARDRGASRESTIPAYGTGVASTSGVSSRSGPGEPGTGAGAGPSQHGNRWQIRETMDVIGVDGEKIGTVKAVHGTDFLLARPAARDLFVPFSAVRTVDGERIMLNVRSGEVDTQHWPASDLTGANERSSGR